MGSSICNVNPNGKKGNKNVCFNSFQYKIGVAKVVGRDINEFETVVPLMDKPRQILVIVLYVQKMIYVLAPAYSVLRRVSSLNISSIEKMYTPFLLPIFM